jgi:DNA polymerase III epsilon subunit family exonuclease
MFDIPELVALDLETTGLKPLEGDRIIEIALIRIAKSSEVIEKFVTVVNPERQIPPDVFLINGITDDMVKTAPCFKDIAGKVFDFIAGRTLLIHNADFDIPFLEIEFKRCGTSIPETKVIDTLAIARNSFIFPKNSLSRIAAYYNINTDGLHRAESDAMMTYKIYRKFCEEWERR